jgi:uncharacterized membrane protein
MARGQLIKPQRHKDTKRTETVLRIALWCAIAILVPVGVVAAIGRAGAVVDDGFLYNQLRQMVPATAIEEMDQFNQWFSAHPAPTLLHVVPGTIFFFLAPFQFSSRIRTRYIRFHRWSGRIVLLAALIIGVSGLYLGSLFPYGGLSASSAVFFFGVLFLIAVMRAFISIRRHDFVRHREWMIRMFSIGIGIATIRVIGSVLFLIFHARFEEMAGVTFWIGFGLNYVVAESWIRYTYPRRLAMRNEPARAIGD